MDSTSFRSFVDRTPSTVGDARIPTLFPDEHISVRCDSCRCRMQMGKTFDATLISTNYRLIVVRAVERQTDVPRRMKLHDERVSIPLCAIYSLRYADASHGGESNGLGGALSPFRANLRRSKKGGGGGGGKDGDKSTEKELKQFKPLVTSISSMEIISCLKVYLKDMRVLFIDLRNAASASNLANHLLHFSRPPKADRLPLLEGGGGRKVPFTTRHSWEEELRRLVPKERQSMWRVIDLESEGLETASYPPAVVVCAGLSVTDVREGTHSWVGGRFPVWVYAWKGTVLMRSGLPPTPVSASAAQTQRKFEDRIAGTHDSQAVPHVIRCDGQELAVDKIGAAFEKLHKICAVDNSARAHRYSKVWPSRVAETGWLQAVTSALAAAAETVARLVDHEESVLLQDGEGRDVSAVVSSLVQVCLDKQARRFDGLQRLIEKEWISLGHSFSRRLLSVEGAPFSPVFLLFLDALSQLIDMYPTQFEYTSSALVALWDLVLTGTVGSLSCEHAMEQTEMGRTSSAFPLDAHFKEPVTLLFSSVQYAAAALLTKTGRSVPLLADILRPPTCAPNVRLWNECYLRWQPEAVIKGGGPLLQSWALDRLMDKRQEEMGVQWTMTIGTIDDDMISSCFPYSSPRTDEEQMVGHSERPSIGSIASLATLQISRDTDYEDYGAPPTPLSTPINNSTSPTVTITHTPTVPIVRYHSGSVTVSGEGSAVPLTPTSTRLEFERGRAISTPVRQAPSPVVTSIPVRQAPSPVVTSIPVRQAPPVPPKTFPRSYV